MKIPHLLISLMLVISAMPMLAKEDLDIQKINMVKKLYDKKYLRTFPRNEDRLYNNATADLKKVFDYDLACGTKYNAICAIDYDVTTQSQDPEAFANEVRIIKYDVIPEGNIKVTFNNTSLYYIMSCHNGNCLIDDIFEPSWDNSNKYISFKVRIKELLKESLQDSN